MMGKVEELTHNHTSLANVCFLYARLETGRIMWLGTRTGGRPHNNYFGSTVKVRYYK